MRECAGLWQSSDHKSLRALGAVEIRTGEKTILDYLLKPVMKGREAFRER